MQGSDISCMSITDWLAAILKKRLSSDAWSWLADAAEKNRRAPSERHVFIQFSMAIRQSGKDKLSLSSEELHAAQNIIANWTPQYWRIDHAIRIYLVLCLDGLAQADFCTTLDRLFQAADLGEAEALYLSLPLLPYPDAHVARASEGLRSNIKTVFEAVAHFSPYPRQHFDEMTWNQMVLKALFVDAQLDPIVGLDERCNAALTTMLCQYAHERWAASREISIELWRCVGAHPETGPETQAFTDLERVLSSGSSREQCAIALSLQACTAPQALHLQQQYPQVYEQLTQGLCWQDLLANP